MRRILLILALLGLSGPSLAQAPAATFLSSTLFISSLGLVNADGNMTSWNILHDPTRPYETNPIAAPFATGESHYIYTAGSCALLTGGRSLLTDLDHRLGLNDVGLKDALTVGIISTEVWVISRWAPYKDDVIGEVVLSEAEFLITSTVFNWKF